MKKFKLTMEDLYAWFLIGAGIGSVIYIICKVIEWTV